MSALLGNNAGAVLLAGIERIESLTAEINCLQGDKSDEFKALKAQGFDTKVLKAVIKRRAMNNSDVEEQDALLDLYSRALEEAAANRRLKDVDPSRARTKQATPEPPNGQKGEEGEAAPASVEPGDDAASPSDNFDPETGEVIEDETPAPADPTAGTESEPPQDSPGSDVGSAEGVGADAPAPDAQDPAPPEPPEPEPETKKAKATPKAKEKPEASSQDDLLDIPDFLKRDAENKPNGGSKA